MNRLMWALSATVGLICKGYDVGNAFAEAPTPNFDFFMKPDKQFKCWWEEHLGNPPLAPDEVIPIQHALQGHSKSPCLWDKHITKFLIEMKNWDLKIVLTSLAFTIALMRKMYRST